MKCFKCSRTIDSPIKNDIIWNFVVARQTFHSSWTSHSQISSSTTITHNAYQFVSREDVALCSKCIKRRNKLRLIIFLIFFILTIPFWLALSSLIQMIDFYLYIMVIGFLGGMFVLYFFSFDVLTDSTYRYLMKSYRKMGYGTDIEIFPLNNWEKISQV